VLTAAIRTTNGLRLNQQAVYFVTRLKENADYGVLEKREVPQRRGVLRDEVIFFYKLAQAGQDAYFRRSSFYMRSANACWYF